jgi:Fic-DOC domain mobile mystery protein B
MSEDVGWFGFDPAGSTPLSEEDLRALKPAWVTTRSDLNLVERDNIVKALKQARWRRLGLALLLDDLTIRALHRAMFEDVWTWAGQYRIRELSLGVDPAQVSICIRDLADNAKYWLTGTDAVALDLAACRLHHRLVQIHAFQNGNGRHARAYTDLVLRAAGRPPFTWGRLSARAAELSRSEYLAALRAADRGELSRLAAFVRT